YCPGVSLVPIRGNVPTRISHLIDGKYDGIILAAAGMTRLKLDAPHITELPTDRFVPAPSQGALAIETRRDSDAEALGDVIDDRSVRQTVEAERAVLRAVAATCQTPVAALALSVGFLRDAPAGVELWAVGLLVWSWVLFAGAIISTFGSFAASRRAINAQLNVLDRKLLGKAKSGDKLQTRWSPATAVLNGVSGVAFVGAIILTVIFVSINVLQ
ncbi:MAG: hypothetical protein IIB90_15975, partial [Gemmatimonadetes bacterium]|nr:hypothetical protein [Gemmatimonadota bacterium]